MHRRTACSLGVALLLAASALPATASAASPESAKVSLNGCWPDDHGTPVFDDTTVEPDHVDVTDGPATVAVTVSAHDTGGPGPASGIRTVVFDAYSSHSGVDDVPMTLGDDGLWHGDVTIPQGTPGDLDYRFVATDGAGQQIDSDIDGAVQTISITSDPDTEAPRLTDLTVSDHSVDTRRHAAHVDVTVTAPDEGVGGTTAVLLRIRSKGHTSNLPRRMVNLPGTDQYRLTIPVPRLSGSSRWKLGFVMVDRFENARRLHNPALADRDGWFDVRSGPLDQTPPQVKVQHWTRRLDVRHGPGFLRVRALLTDDTGIQGATLKRLPLHRISGTARRGVWAAKVPIPVCGTQSRQVTGRVVVIDAHDNFTRSDPLPDARVVAKDRVAPHAYRSFPGGDHSRVDILFDEDVTGISTGTIQVLGYLATPDDTVEDGTWRCRDESGNPTSCDTGWVRTARFVAADDSAELSRIVWAPDHHLDVRDRHGNPITIWTDLVVD